MASKNNSLINGLLLKLRTKRTSVPAEWVQIHVLTLSARSHSGLCLFIFASKESAKLQKLSLLDVPHLQRPSLADLDVFSLPHQTPSVFQSPLIDPVSVYLTLHMEWQFDNGLGLSEILCV